MVKVKILNMKTGNYKYWEKKVYLLGILIYKTYKITSNV